MVIQAAIICVANLIAEGTIEKISREDGAISFFRSTETQSRFSTPITTRTSERKPHPRPKPKQRKEQERDPMCKNNASRRTLLCIPCEQRTVYFSHISESTSELADCFEELESPSSPRLKLSYLQDPFG